MQLIWYFFLFLIWNSELVVAFGADDDRFWWVYTLGLEATNFYWATACATEYGMEFEVGQHLPGRRRIIKSLISCIILRVQYFVNVEANVKSFFGLLWDCASGHCICMNLNGDTTFIALHMWAGISDHQHFLPFSKRLSSHFPGSALTLVSSVLRTLFQNSTDLWQVFLTNSNLTFLILRFTNGLNKSSLFTLLKSSVDYWHRRSVLSSPVDFTHVWSFFCLSDGFLGLFGFFPT